MRTIKLWHKNKIHSFAVEECGHGTRILLEFNGHKFWTDDVCAAEVIAKAILELVKDARAKQSE